MYSYSADPQHSFEVRIGNGHLFGVDQPGEKMTLELFPIKDNNLKFMEREGEEGTFKFVMDEKGKANEMTTITPSGTNISLKRIK